MNTDNSLISVIVEWMDTPMIVALLFGFAGAVFVGIYFLRRARARGKTPQA